MKTQNSMPRMRNDADANRRMWNAPTAAECEVQDATQALTQFRAENRHINYKPHAIFDSISHYIELAQDEYVGFAKHDLTMALHLCQSYRFSLHVRACEIALRELTQ